VCDVPRYPDEGAVAVVAAADLTVLVSPIEFRACMAAKQVLSQLNPHTDRIALVASGLLGDERGPEKTASLVGLPLLATLTPEWRIARTLETGEFELSAKSSLVAAARAVLAELRLPVVAEAA
jgi:hypothetical protein